MNVKDIINILNDYGLSEVEELVAADKYSLINFYFDFDKDVEAAAKAYADDESTAGSEEWMNEFYLPYLYAVLIQTSIFFYLLYLICRIIKT